MKRDAVGNEIQVGDLVAYFTGGGSGPRLPTACTARVVKETQKTVRLQILKVGRDYDPPVRPGEELIAQLQRVVKIS